MLIYLDSVILIYALDHVGTFQTRADNRLRTIATVGDQIALSDLSRLECRVKPIQLGDLRKLQVFDSFFARPDIQVMPLPSSVFDRATFIRANHGFKTADALHLAAAIEGGCQLFLTNDFRLSRFPGLAIEVLT
jgi:predicted nucleic acid-binding protein